MNWQDLQAEFIQSLTNPDLSVPEQIGKTAGEPSLKRFNVYRNNSAVSISEALASGFPVVARLVGEEFFKAMASVYMQTNLPTSPLLVNFGENFPEFIKGFEPAQSVPYLADMASVEWAWTQAYNAADATSIDIDQMGLITPEKMFEAKFLLHPSIKLIKSKWPVLSIWSAHQQENTSELLDIIEDAPEQGIIIRPDLEVNVVAILEQVYVFINSIAQGGTLGEAFGQLGTEDPEDLTGCLQLLFNSGSVVDIQ